MEIRLEQISPEGLDTVLPSDAEMRAFEKEMTAGLRRVAIRWRGESKRNAPRGPSETMLRKLHKKGAYTTKATKSLGPQAIQLTSFYRMAAAALSAKKEGTYAGTAGGLKERLSGHNWKNPGGLERSIEFASDEEKAEVYVASNSEAGRYAGIIHDKKGVRWHERGPGTQAKGERADDKFIERAQPGALENLKGIVDKALAKLFGK